MKGDFSRDTFDSKKHYSRVLMQQGRVQTDADWNEQQAITGVIAKKPTTTDIIGACGAPCTIRASIVASVASYLRGKKSRKPKPAKTLASIC